jgi:hypothetical protein
MADRIAQERVQALPQGEILSVVLYLIVTQF